jgi:two-component system NtrC family sensor kinase
MPRFDDTSTNADAKRSEERDDAGLLSIATKVTLVVTLLTGLLLLAAGQVAFTSQEAHDLGSVRDHGRQLVQLLRTTAEQDVLDHGRLGALADLVGATPGQKVVFYGLDGRAVAPVPTEEKPATNKQILAVLANKRPRETVEGSGDQAAYVHRMPLLVGTHVVGAIELRLGLGSQLHRAHWLHPVGTIAGAMLLFFALLVSAFAYRSIGKPVGQLMDGMDAVTKGDLTHIIPLERNDEIGRIAYRFNEMTARLRAAQDEIKRSARDKLSLEGDLRRSEKLATIGQLSAEIAHEVGTPLNVIGGRTRRLKKKADHPDEVIKNAQIISEQVERITRIIKQVLDIARAPARRSPVDLIGIASRATTFLEDQAQQAGVTLETDFQAGVPLVEADPDELQQVALNLLINAIQAMPEGGTVVVTIRAVHRRRGELDLAAPETYLCLAVRDHGVGIPEEDLGRVFTPFFTTKTKGEGTGLGLSIVHGIVKEHDGWIEIKAGRDLADDSEEGTEVSVYLPQASAALITGQTPSDSAIRPLPKPPAKTAVSAAARSDKPTDGERLKR